VTSPTCQIVCPYQGGREFTVPLLNLPCGSVCTHRVPWYTITPQMLQRMSHRTWRRIRLCFEHDDTHTDPLDAQWLSPYGKLSRGTVTSRPTCILPRRWTLTSSLPWESQISFFNIFHHFEYQRQHTIICSMWWKTRNTIVAFRTSLKCSVCVCVKVGSTLTSLNVTTVKSMH
jgi:hypothetical protein